MEKRLLLLKHSIIEKKCLHMCVFVCIVHVCQHSCYVVMHQIMRVTTSVPTTWLWGNKRRGEMGRKPGERSSGTLVPSLATAPLSPTMHQR